jgi:glycosyl hydrolase family 123
MRYATLSVNNVGKISTMDSRQFANYVKPGQSERMTFQGSRLHILSLYMVMSIMVLSGITDNAVAGVLTVMEFGQKPNYSLSTDEGDIRQLTDGRITSFPMWERKEAVGWSARAPVTIRLRLDDGSSVQSPKAGTLRVHTVKGLYAGVDVPRQVDVYARDRKNNLQLVGSLAPDSGKLPDKETHWLDIDISAATGALIMVVHATGKFLFLDEVEWRPSGVGRMPAQTAIVPNVETALKESTHRTHQALLNAIESESRKMALPLERWAMRAWVQDPWAAIDPAQASEHINIPLSALEIRGYTEERENACLGLAVGEAVVTSGVRATIEGLPAGSVRLFEVRPVVAANGQRVYDPLVPLTDGGLLTVQPGIPSYIWLDVNLTALGPGTHRFELRFESSSSVISVPGSATVTATDVTHIRPLRAINWAYPSDMPIFHNPEAAVRDLVDHGINVFVTQPEEIPGFALDGTWEDREGGQFVNNVELAKQHGMLLIYMGWDAGRNPLGFSKTKQTIDPAAKKRLLAWVGKVFAYLSAKGLPPDRWAFYPTDEPNRTGLQLVKVFAETVKRWNSSIQIYANPIVQRSSPIEMSDLRNLDPLVDFWQPQISALHGPLGEFYKGLRKEWWLISSPKSPAKLNSPLHEYRMLGWWAWHYGAKGVGFWSYSDTTGSSAWLDIDGYRSDFAVVYESEDGIVSSRRWEAFREGLEDYRLLAAQSQRVQRSLGTINLETLESWQSADLEAVRRTLLGVSSQP